jgi:hypothetical protein
MLKKQIPLLVSILVGIIVVGEYFLNLPLLTGISKEIQSWAVLVSAFLIVVGMVNSDQVNARAFRDKRIGVLDILVIMGGLVAMFIVTYFNEQFSAAYKFLFDNVYSTLGNAASGILMYSTASATFRGLRAKSSESIAFLLAAVIGMLGLAPIGAAISDKLPALYEWFLEIPNVAGQRGITVSASIGAMAASLRVLLGIERRFAGE